MSSPHPSYPSPGPSSYYHNPPPPPQFYGNVPPPGPYYNPYMPPMNGHAPMHQPASPRINSPGRGRYPTQTQRGGIPSYQHYPPPMPPPPHGLHPGATMQSPPISPVNPYTHPHAPKYPSHAPHIPYSPTYHPQPNGGYHPGWSQPPPLPKQLSMLSPAMRSPAPVPASSLPQELPPQELPPVQTTPEQPSVVPQQVIAESPILSQQPPPAPPQPVAERLLVQPATEPVESTISPSEHIQASTDVVPELRLTLQPVKLEFLSEQEQDGDLSHQEATAAGVTNEPNDIPSGWVIWSRRPQDPSHAPGVIIATQAFPPTNIVDRAVDLPTPPPSPKVPSVKLITVEPSVHEAEFTEEPTGHSPDDGDAPSSSVTESTPANSTPGETPVPGSPATSRTSVSLPITSPPAGKGVDKLASAEASHADEPLSVAVPVEKAATPAPISTAASSAQPTELQQATEAPAPAKPVVKKSWASLLQSNDASASSSKSRLPTSSVIGFSIPATAMGASSAGPSAAHGTAAVPHRAELLKVLSNGPPPSNVPPKIQPRGLVNTGNMCFANAVLQVLVYCQPFNRLFSELSRYLAGPVVGSQKEGTKATPLVDAIIQFTKEFAPEPQADAKAKGKERDDFYEPEAFIPTNVYDAMKEKKRFANMIVGHLLGRFIARKLTVISGWASGRCRGVLGLLLGHTRGRAVISFFVAVAKRAEVRCRRSRALAG